jgi:hypothetical protein
MLFGTITIGSYQVRHKEQSNITGQGNSKHCHHDAISSFDKLVTTPTCYCQNQATFRLLATHFQSPQNSTNRSIKQAKKNEYFFFILDT